MNITSGTVIPQFEVHSVPIEAMKTMALLLRDPNPIHWDAAAVKDLGMGDRVINQGPTNMAYVVNMLIAWTGDPARIRSLNFRFQDNVRGGDHVIAGGVVTDVRNEDGEQVAHCDVWLDVVDGPRALSGTAAVTL
jgi:acyl dehydratase